jgi:hypothetical protein
MSKFIYTVHQPHPLNPPLLQRRGGGDFREGLHPSLTYTPPSLIKGRGQGDRLLKNSKKY